MDLGLNGKRAFVTGGSHGIGKAIAIGLAREGCQVGICSRTIERLEQTKSDMQNEGLDCFIIQCDVLENKSIDLCVERIKGAWGHLDILVNNAGGGGRWGTEKAEECAYDTWFEVYQKNALSSVRFTMSFIPMMKERGWGRVVTITSLLGKETGGRPWFNMAKTAQTVLMKNLATRKDLARSGITFNSVAPGAIMVKKTGWDIEKAHDPSGFKQTVESLPLGRMGTPQEVASVVAFLCSEQASLVNGSSILVDGAESRCF
jgi:3-oxoacyl-[acyl-carrier protein] reductase